MLKAIILSGAVALGTLAAVPANATLIGIPVTGTLAFGPNGSFGGQYWPSQNAVVGAGVEYTYVDGANTDTADFTATQVIITDNDIGTANGWEMTFSTPGGFTGLSLVSSNFDPSLTFNLASGLLVFDWVGTEAAGVTYTATFDVANAPAVPEPSTLLLLFSGLAGLGAARRRKTAKT
jgi:hypothetical protein